MKHVIFSVFFIILLIYPSGIFADAIILKDGKELKGLVVDEYVDRIVLSTFEGEKNILRKDIGDIRYEDTEVRLLKLGDEAMARGRYKAAIYYYKAILKLNPNSIEARDGELAAVRKDLNSGAEIAKEEIELMIALDQPASGSAERSVAVYEKNVRDLLGLKIKKDKESGACYVEDVLAGSVSAEHGMKKNDIISAVWNENVKYMNYDAIINKLSGPEFSMAKLSIERNVTFSAAQRPKWDIGLREEGYFVKNITGIKGSGKGLIKPDDWIVEVDSISTRYMPKNELTAFLSSSKKPLDVLIKRDLYMTRKRGR